MENVAELKIEGRVGQIWIRSGGKFVTIFRADTWEIETKALHYGSRAVPFGIQSRGQTVFVQEFEPPPLPRALYEWNFEAGFRTVRLWRDEETVIQFDAMMTSLDDGNPRTATFAIDEKITEYLIRR